MYWLKSIFCLLIFCSVFDINAQNFIYKNADSSPFRSKKLADELIQQLNSNSLSDGDSISLMLSVIDPVRFVESKKYNKPFSILLTHAETGTLLIRTTINWLKNNASKDTSIRFISNSRKPFTERELTGFDLTANKVNLAHKNWPFINGKGLTISIKERQMDTLDIDFKGRYVSSPTASKIMETHATNMATIAAGAGNSFYSGKGVAWGANLSSSDFNNLLPDNTADLQLLNVAIQNHSYGVGIENYYGADAAAYDLQSIKNPSLLHVFSSGNAGNQTAGSGVYSSVSGVANLTGSFKMAKNILTVGATDSLGTVIPISSRGPAYDGRMKPELVAFGEDGTSGAAAIVSGIGLLLQSAWQQSNVTSSLANASLIKAVLLNSADDVGQPGIDHVTGFGAVNASRAIQTIVEKKFIQGTIKHQETNKHAISFPQNAKNIKVTLSWTDPAAIVNSSVALVNDLDLILVNTVTAEKWLPWVLNNKPQKDSLQLLPVRSRDSLNNNEQITLDTLKAGNYQLSINGFNINTAEQAYSIAWQYDTIAHFNFNYPVKGDNLTPAAVNIVRWETTLTGNGILQYRLNNGDWKIISNNIQLQKKYHQWNIPDTIATVQLKLIAGQREWLTDTISVSKRLLINTGFNCLDSFLIYWQKAAVKNYRVYRLGEQYMDSFSTLSDTILIQKKINNPYEYFSVAPVLADNIEGLRSYTFNYAKQQIDCYISGFIAYPSGTSDAKLNLALGTTYLLKNIFFQKLTAAGYENIKMISPVTEKSITAIVPANKGLNTYRAKIELYNGLVYYTQPDNIQVFEGQSYYLFPNPVITGSALRLMCEEPDETVFMLFNMNGGKIIEQKISSFLEQIKLPLLQKGVYYAVILKSGIIQKTQPLVIM